MLGNTRDLGLNHGAGKGDKNRSDPKAFRDGYDNIQWDLTRPDMERRGHKLVKRYGGIAPETIEELREFILNTPPNSLTNILNIK